MCTPHWFKATKQPDVPLYTSDVWKKRKPQIGHSCEIANQRLDIR